MDDGIDSDEDLLLTGSSFSDESLLPNSSIGSIVDSILLNNDDLGQQNSERNVVDQSRGTEKLHWKSSILDGEELGMRKESRLKELYTLLLFSIYIFC